MHLNGSGNEDLSSRDLSFHDVSLSVQVPSALCLWLGQLRCISLGQAVSSRDLSSHDMSLCVQVPSALCLWLGQL